MTEIAVEIQKSCHGVSVQNDFTFIAFLKRECYGSV